MARLNEDDLIARYFAPLAGAGGLGLKDDAALVAVKQGYELIATNDALVAGVHFFEEDPADAIARKALRVNLSDLAAKGAEPIGFLLALMLPPNWQEPWLAQFTRGLHVDSLAFDIALLGGDTVLTRGPLTLSITALGQVPPGQMVARAGARAGDALYVSGTIGDAALGLALRLGRAMPVSQAADVFLKERYLLPRPRMVLTSALRRFAHGAMDVSDGFVGDLTKMLHVSGVGAEVETARVPFSTAARAAIEQQPDLRVTALTGGDDYEIICAVPQTAKREFEAEALGLGVPMTCVGRATEARQVIWRNARGELESFGIGRYQHF